MDVEVVQRINKLAVELQKQGLATNRSDAISQAERIFQGQGTVVPTPNYVSPVKGYDSPRPQITGLGQERIEQILEKNTKFLVTTIKDFQAKMEAMGRELNMMKHKLANIKSAPQRPQLKEFPATPVTQTAPIAAQSQMNQGQAPQMQAQTPITSAPQARQVPIQAPKSLYSGGQVPQSAIQGHNRGATPKAAQGSSSHPRVGKFETDDVSIEKFFYAGSK